ncbi:hypothetical protein [Nocardia callitridis]|uniref:DUF4040 domain-containing protein n=1 Tax=Nocardia callitridis TaxID=648753 RepID=A0ABP9JTN7_9NOCA
MVGCVAAAVAACVVYAVVLVLVTLVQGLPFAGAQAIAGVSFALVVAATVGIREARGRRLFSSS